MWNSRDIILIEVGSGIIKAANSPDSRSKLSKWLNGPKENDAQLLIAGTARVRKSLAEKGIMLPNIRFIDNQEIGVYEFISYWGIEKVHYSLSSLSDLFDFIYNKALEYHTNQIVDYGQTALSLIKKDEFQQAYDVYTKVYYKARTRLDFHTCSRCLTEVAMIIAMNGQIELASTFAFTAIDYAKSLNIVDTHLKCQCHYNAANLIKYTNPGKAVQLLKECKKIAFDSENVVFLFFANIAMAEIYGYYNEFKTAIEYYKSALKLIGNGELALKIQSSMMETYDLLIYQMQNHNDNNPSPKWRKVVGKFTGVLVEQILKTTASSFVMKAFNVNGVLSLFSFGRTFVLKNNLFNAPTVIGDNNKILL